MSRTITHIVIHCADTPTGRHVLPADVDAWHLKRGFQRTAAWRRRFNPELRAIGYHYLIDVDGQIYTGRHHDETGAHAQGHNSSSLGICLAGKGAYTVAQWQSLRLLVEKLQGQGSGRRTEPAEVVKDQKAFDSPLPLDPCPLPLVVGHRDLPGVAKTCPNFSVADWLKGGMEPLSVHTAGEV